MNTDADRQVHRPEDGTGGLDGDRRVSTSDEAGDEEGHDPVAQQLVDEPVWLPDGVARDAHVLVDGGGVFSRRHRLGKAGRAADVREESRDLNLGATGVLLGLTEATVAQLRVRWITAVPEEAHDRAAETALRCETHFAPRIRWDVAEHLSFSKHVRVLAHEDHSPILAGDALRIGHGFRLSIALSSDQPLTRRLGSQDR